MFGLFVRKFEKFEVRSDIASWSNQFYRCSLFPRLTSMSVVNSNTLSAIVSDVDCD